MVTEPGTPRRAWARQEVWSHGQPHQGPSAMTTAMTLAQRQGRSSHAQKPPWQRAEPSRLDPGGLRRPERWEPLRGGHVWALSVMLQALEHTAWASSLAFTAQLFPSLQGAKAGRRAAASSLLL